MMPLAPGLFSTTTACFQLSARRAATMRARLSAVTPCVYGTTSTTGRAGKPCACAAAEATRPGKSASADRYVRVMVTLPMREPRLVVLPAFPGALDGHGDALYVLRRRADQTRDAEGL